MREQERATARQDFVPRAFALSAAIRQAIQRPLSDLARELTQLREDLDAAVSLARVESSLWQLRYGFPQFLVLGPEDRLRILAEEPRLYQDIKQRMAVYTASRLSPEERQALADWNEHFTKYVQARPL
jgi:hypothetical protein